MTESFSVHAGYQISAAINIFSHCFPKRSVRPDRSSHYQIAKPALTKKYGEVGSFYFIRLRIINLAGFTATGNFVNNQPLIPQLFQDRRYFTVISHFRRKEPLSLKMFIGIKLERLLVLLHLPDQLLLR